MFEATNIFQLVLMEQERKARKVQASPWLVYFLWFARMATPRTGQPRPKCFIKSKFSILFLLLPVPYVHNAHLVERNCSSLWNVISVPCSETGLNQSTLFCVNSSIQITQLCTEVNISILKKNNQALWVFNQEWRVWLNGQGGWKYCPRCGFDSWQFVLRENMLLGSNLQICKYSKF